MKSTPLIEKQRNEAFFFSTDCKDVSTSFKSLIWQSIPDLPILRLINDTDTNIYIKHGHNIISHAREIHASIIVTIIHGYSKPETENNTSSLFVVSNSNSSNPTLPYSHKVRFLRIISGLVQRLRILQNLSGGR